MGTITAEVLGWILALAQTGAALPQIIRLARTRRIEGLSVATELLWIPSWAGWVFYVAEVHLWPRVFSEGAGLVIEIATATLLLTGLAKVQPVGPAVRRTLPLVAACVAAVIAARVLGGTPAMAIALTGLDTIALVPLIRTTLTSPSLRGISVWAWIFKTCVYTGWITYALAIGNPLSAGWVYLMLPVAAIMLSRLAVDRGLSARLRARATHGGKPIRPAEQSYVYWAVNH